MSAMNVCGFSLAGGRDVNEDAIRFDRRGGRAVAVAADGLGGEGGGDAASRAAADAALDALMRAPRLDRRALLGAMERANAAVLARQLEAGGGVMTTLTLAAAQGLRLWVAHVGDTRAYRFRGGRLLSCTRDDSVTQSLADSGEITREQMRTHESRNLLLKCLGRLELPDPTIRCFMRLGHDRLLVCTDGLWEKFSDAELCALMAGDSAEAALARLRRAALARVGPDSDNLSAVLLG